VHPGTDRSSSSRAGQWAFLALALILPSLATWLYFVVFGGQPLMRTVYSISKAVQFSLPLLFVSLFAGAPVPMALRSTRGLWQGIAFGLVTAVAIQLLYHLLLSKTAAFADMAPRLREKVAGMGALSPARFLLLGAFISFIHSFLEEYYWRWFVYARLRPLAGLGTANLVSSVGFMLHHILVVGVYLGWSNWPLVGLLSMGVAVGGLVWAWMFERFGNVTSPWVSHLLVDCSLIAVGYHQLWG